MTEKTPYILRVPLSIEKYLLEISEGLYVAQHFNIETRKTIKNPRLFGEDIAIEYSISPKRQTTFDDFYSQIERFNPSLQICKTTYQKRPTLLEILSKEKKEENTEKEKLILMTS